MRGDFVSREQSHTQGVEFWPPEVRIHVEETMGLCELKCWTSAVRRLFKAQLQGDGTSCPLCSEAGFSQRGNHCVFTEPLVCALPQE